MNLLRERFLENFEGDPTVVLPTVFIVRQFISI